MTELLLEVQSIPEHWQEVIFSSIDILSNIQKGIMNNKSLLYGLLGTIIGAFVTFGSVFLSRNTSNKQERKALKGVVEDLYRHFQANIDVLDSIDLAKGIPSRLYFGRFKVDDTSIVFCENICKCIKRKYLHAFNRLRLVYRNGNIELDTVCEYLVSDRYDSQIMLQYIQLLRERQERLMESTRKFRIAMENGQKVDFPKEEKRLRPIVYETPSDSGAAATSQ